jgi:hypothetical protein
MRFFVVCAAIALLAACGARQDPGQAPAVPSPSGTSSVPGTEAPNVNDDRMLEEARKKGKVGVGLIVSTVEGRTDEAAAAFRALGGFVESSDPKVGYLRVRLPARAIAEARKIPSVKKIDIEGLVDRIEPPS